MTYVPPNQSDYKNSVRFTTTANITLSGLGTAAGRDWASPVTANDRILVKNQTTASQNGIYLAQSGAWVRARDADGVNEVTAGMTTFVSEGVTLGNTKWVLTTDDPITLGTTALTFASDGIPTLDGLLDVDTTGAIDGALLRYESSGTPQWNDTTTLFLNDAGQLQIQGLGSSGGLLIGGDTQIYRDSSNVLRTPDSLVVDGSLTVSNGALLNNNVSIVSGVLNVLPAVTPQVNGVSLSAGQYFRSTGSGTTKAYDDSPLSFYRFAGYGYHGMTFDPSMATVDITSSGTNPLRLDSFYVPYSGTATAIRFITSQATGTVHFGLYKLVGSNYVLQNSTGAPIAVSSISSTNGARQISIPATSLSEGIWAIGCRITVHAIHFAGSDGAGGGFVGQDSPSGGAIKAFQIINTSGLTASIPAPTNAADKLAKAKTATVWYALV